ncbi:MAG: hypothetical protein V1778_00140 [bacterium]
MTEERWLEIVGRIKDTFTVEEEYTEPLTDEPGTVRGIVFAAPTGKMKLEYLSQPVVLGTHGVGSKRIGSTTAVAYEYSPTETRESVKAYRWQDAAWAEIDAEALLSLQK